MQYFRELTGKEQIGECYLCLLNNGEHRFLQMTKSYFQCLTTENRVAINAIRGVIGPIMPKMFKDIRITALKIKDKSDSVEQLEDVDVENIDFCFHVHTKYTWEKSPYIEDITSSMLDIDIHPFAIGRLFKAIDSMLESFKEGQYIRISVYYELEQFTEEAYNR